MNTTAGWLDGQVAVITGAGTGIGAAVAARFVAEGAAVVLAGRRPEPLREVAAALGDRAVGVPAEAAPGTAGDVTDDAWSQHIRANLTTCLVSARACLPQLVERRGCVIVVSSIAGLVATPESVGYVTAKNGVIGLARSITRDYGPLGVRVNTVCPGWVRTPMADEEMDQLAAQHGLPDRDAAYALATAQVPLRKPAEPAEVAAVVAFLASGHASAVSGAVLTVDCGGTAVDLPSIAFDSL